MFCVYCGIDHNEDVPLSREHIVPYAIGGSNAFSISVCRESNNRLGGNVDKPFVEIWTIRAERLFLNLAGTDNTEPMLEFKGKSQIRGRETDVSYKLRPDSRELKTTRPSIQKIATGNGEQWEISGDPMTVKQIVEGKLRSELAKGKQMTTASGEILTLENLEVQLSQYHVETLNPSLLMEVQIDPAVCARFFAKLALATGHYVLGETFSRSSRAAALRAAMTGETLEQSTAPRARIWPHIAGMERAMEPFQVSDSHVLGIFQGDPPTFISSLFGRYDAIIPLGDLREGDRTRPSDRGTIVKIDLPSRRFTRQTLIEYLAGFLRPFEEE